MLKNGWAAKTGLEWISGIKSIGMKKRILKAGLHVSAAEMKKSQST